VTGLKRAGNSADAGFGNLGEGCPRPSAYLYLRQQVRERTRAVTDGLCGCTGRAAISPDLRFEVKELGEIDMVSMALVAAIDTELLEPPDAGTESWFRQPDLPWILASWQERDLVPRDVAPEFAARSLRVWRANQDAVRDWRPSPYIGPVDVFGLSATVVQRRHGCGTNERLAGALRELLG
jgi:hypothetical protein